MYINNMTFNLPIKNSDLKNFSFKHFYKINQN